MKTKVQMIVILGFFILLVGIGEPRYNKTAKNVSLIAEMDLLQDDYYKQYEENCLAFIENNYITSIGAVVEDQSKETVVAKEQLLYMRYLLQKDKKKAFEESTDYIVNTMLTEKGMLGIVKEEVLVRKFSTYDQLQLFKLVYNAYDKWGNEKYKNMGILIEEHLYGQYTRDDRFYPYYKIKQNEEMDSQIPLYFLDLSGLTILRSYREVWGDVYNESKKLIENAYISKKFPFYHTTYDYEESTYNVNHKANMLDTMQIVLNMAQVKCHKSETIDWLKETLKKGVLYAEYDKETGIPTNRFENVGVYAVVAQVGKVIGDIELYTLAIERMLGLQIKDEESALNGGFKSSETQELNLYDNLNALLAF